MSLLFPSREGRHKFDSGETFPPLRSLSRCPSPAIQCWYGHKLVISSIQWYLGSAGNQARDLYSPLIKPVQVTFQTSLAHGLRSFRMRLVWGLRL